MKTENWKLKLKAGFTLVELLIVIALIGVLAVALVATLNPIEQVNKATDARYKNDAAELLAAIERYYASNLQYPWVGEDICGTNGSTNCADNDEFIGQPAQTDGLGVCGDATCSTGGELITTDELKDSFRRKDQFTDGASESDRLYVVKGDQSTSVYVCFIPSSGTNRRNAVLADIWDGDYQEPVNCSDTPNDWTELDVADGACVMCAPEIGAVVSGT